MIPESEIFIVSHFHSLACSLSFVEFLLFSLSHCRERATKRTAFVFSFDTHTWLQSERERHIEKSNLWYLSTQRTKAKREITSLTPSLSPSSSVAIRLSLSLDRPSHLMMYECLSPDLIQLTFSLFLLFHSLRYHATK